MIVTLLAVGAVGAHPAKLLTYKDWIVGCDNVRVCEASALETERSEDFLDLSVDRGAKPNDKASLSVSLPDGAKSGARLSLNVDSANVITFTADEKGNASLPLTGALLATLRNGRRATLVDAGGKKLGETSLAGLAAALRYMDDRQGRLGTKGALAAPGGKPDSSVPAAPTYPVIVVPGPSSKPPRTLTVAAAVALIGPDNAKCGDADRPVKPKAFRLDATHSVVLVDHPCGNGAYNMFTSVYVVDEPGKVRPGRFDVPPGMVRASKEGPGDLTNGDWNPKTRRLESWEKGRGLGDCGSSETYAWDGAVFRLVEQAEMDECRGSINFIRTWVARTSR